MPCEKTSFSAHLFCSRTSACFLAKSLSDCQPPPTRTSRVLRICVGSSMVVTNCIHMCRLVPWRPRVLPLGCRQLCCRLCTFLCRSRARTEPRPNTQYAPNEIPGAHDAGRMRGHGFVIHGRQLWFLIVDKIDDRLAYWRLRAYLQLVAGQKFVNCPVLSDQQQVKPQSMISQKVCDTIIAYLCIYVCMRLYKHIICMFVHENDFLVMSEANQFVVTGRFECGNLTLWSC